MSRLNGITINAHGTLLATSKSEGSFTWIFILEYNINTRTVGRELYKFDATTIKRFTWHNKEPWVYFLDDRKFDLLQLLEAGRLNLRHT